MVHHAALFGDVKHTGLDANINAEMYYQYLQVLRSDEVRGSTMTLVLRTNADPASMTASARNECAKRTATWQCST